MKSTFLTMFALLVLSVVMVPTEVHALLAPACPLKIEELKCGDGTVRKVYYCQKTGEDCTNPKITDGSCQQEVLNDNALNCFCKAKPKAGSTGMQTMRTQDCVNCGESITAPAGQHLVASGKGYAMVPIGQTDACVATATVSDTISI